MKKIMKLILPVFTLAVFTFACSKEPEVEAEKNAENTNNAASNEDATDEASKEDVDNRTFQGPTESIPSSQKVEVIEKTYDGITNDGFIESIEPQNEHYTDLVIYVNDKFNHLSEKAYQAKLEGMGTSIREMTSGALHEKADGTLPTLEFRDQNDNVFGKFYTHSREERMSF